MKFFWSKKLFIVGFFFGFSIFIVYIVGDALLEVKNHINTSDKYVFLLKELRFIDNQNKILQSKNIPKNRFAELPEYREYFEKIGNEKFKIHFREYKNFGIYIKNPKQDFLEKIDFEKIKMLFNGKMVEIDTKIIKESNGIEVTLKENWYDIGLKQIMIYSDKEEREYWSRFLDQKHVTAIEKKDLPQYQSLNQFIDLRIPYKNGEILELHFSYEPATIIISKEFSTENPLIQLIFWWYGIKFDKEKIENVKLY